VRIRFAKLGKVRFTSHRDTARIWERALRRAGIRAATTSGFTPRPRVSFGLALPTAAESIAEYLDVELVDGELADAEPSELPARLDAALPSGFHAMLAHVLEPGAGSLQEIVTAVTWELSPPEGTDIPAAAGRLMAAEALPLARERKGERRVDDVRPLIGSLSTSADGVTMIAELATVGRSLRPAELATLAFPDTDPVGVRVMRTHQWIEHDGNRRELLALPDAVRAPTGRTNREQEQAWTRPTPGRETRRVKEPRPVVNAGAARAAGSAGASR
jgi:radical SAM-linked protein